MFFKQKSRCNSEEDKLMNSLSLAHNQLETAVAVFNEQTDNMAIDYASYNLLAARARYSYLLSIAKEKKISV